MNTRNCRYTNWRCNGIFALIVLVLFSTCQHRTSTIDSRESIVDCGPEGTARNPKNKRLNRLKNRMEMPSAKDYSEEITLLSILEEGTDNKRWSPKLAARITGYVCKIKSGTKESCNCNLAGDENNDTHIELVIDESSCGKSRYVVAEITPKIRIKMKELGFDWSTAGLTESILHKKITISGWMMFDIEHAKHSENSKPGRRENGRATAWEIHPVTGIEIVQ